MNFYLVLQNNCYLCSLILRTEKMDAFEKNITTLRLINIKLLINTDIFLERDEQTYLYIIIVCVRSACVRNIKKLSPKKLPSSFGCHSNCFPTENDTSIINLMDGCCKKECKKPELKIGVIKIDVIKTDNLNCTPSFLAPVDADFNLWSNPFVNSNHLNIIKYEKITFY